MKRFKWIVPKQIYQVIINIILELLHECDDNEIKGLKDLPINIASKIVGSNLREWGNKVRLTQNGMLRKKYKISEGYRGWYR